MSALANSRSLAWAINPAPSAQHWRNAVKCSEGGRLDIKRSHLQEGSGAMRTRVDFGDMGLAPLSEGRRPLANALCGIRFASVTMRTYSRPALLCGAGFLFARQSFEKFL